MTPENATPAAPLTGANTQQLDAVAGGENGRPEIKETFLRPKVAQKISELLIESGYEETSALAVEAAAKRLYNIQSLRPGSVALAVGAIDLSGAYRMAQLTMFQDGEYVGTVALAETGRYEEGAEPKIPQSLLDNSDQSPVGAHFTLADGVYSAALRSATPEPVAREAVRLLQRLVDLDAPLGAGETLRLLYARNPRSKLQAASRVIYAGLAGPLATVDCYAFELSDGTYRCFTKEDAEPFVAPLPPAPQEFSNVPVAAGAERRAIAAGADRRVATAGQRRGGRWRVAGADPRRADHFAVRHAVSSHSAHCAAACGHRLRRAGRFAGARRGRRRGREHGAGARIRRSRRPQTQRL